MGVARNVIKDAKLVPGGGASEMAVAAILKKKSMSIEGVEQVGDFLLRLACFCKCNIVLIFCLASLSRLPSGCQRSNFYFSLILLAISFEG